MREYTEHELIAAIGRAVPYPRQIEAWETNNWRDSYRVADVRFTWRGVRFSVGVYGGVEVVYDGILAGGEPVGMLMEKLIQRELKG